MLKHLRGLLILLCSIGLVACSTTDNRNTVSAATTKQAQAYNPQAAKINVQLGLAYLKKGMNSRAKEKLLTALQQDPHSAVVNGAMAYFLEMTGSENEAGKYYKAAIHDGGNDGASLNNYGAYLCRKGNYQQAVNYFLKAAEAKHYVETAAAYENAGLCATRIPDHASAEKYFKKALMQDPKLPKSLYEMSVLSYQAKQYKNAENYLDRVLKLLGNNAQTAWLGYRIAEKLGNSPSAANYALLLRTKFPKSKEYQQLKASRQS